MYKLLIVEDEIWEREGLASFVDWHAMDIEIVGTAADGIQGMQMVKELLPDIVMTDIRMPLMDGLALAKEVKSFLPGCKIIIITGYDDFQYAKEALHIGVSDFLLKPIEKNELINAINKITDNLRQERHQEEYVRKLRSRLSERTYKERERFLLNVLAGYSKDNRQLSSDKGLMFPFGSQKTVAAVIRFDGFAGGSGLSGNENQDHFGMFYEKVRKLIGNSGVAVQNYGENREILICLPVKHDGREEIRNLFNMLAAEDSAKNKPDFIIGVGSVSNTAAEFIDSVTHARDALDRLFFLKDARVLFYDDCLCEKNDEICTFLHSVPGFTKRILNAVISSDVREITALNDQLFDFVYSHPVDKNLVCNSLAGMMNELHILMFSKGAPDGFTGENILERFQNCIKLEQLKDYLQNTLVYANGFFSGKRKNKEESIVEDAMKIIYSDYFQNIGLEVVAGRLGVSPNYLGGLFRKHVGKRFTEVITSVRMKKAEELLLSGDDSIMDIARTVGYDNISYFCTVFKKHFGVSPAEYRERKRQ